MSRGLRSEELRIWAVVASTVRPAAGRSPVKAPRHIDVAGQSSAPPPSPVQARRATPKPHQSPPAEIEPGRKRRLTRERDPIELTLDLHGLDQDRARAALVGFLLRAHREGERAVLVITGKGTLGDGVLRRFAPDWLADAALRPVVAGWSPAHRRHGGDGALYVALKRRAAD